MKIIEKPLSDKHSWLLRKAYDDIPSEFVPVIKGTRVLPINYIDSPNVFFELRNRWEPGQNDLFPDGGYEVVDVNGGVHNCFLDQVITHPQTLGMRNFKFGETNELKPVKIKVIRDGKRGRKPLDPEVKALRDAEIAKRKGGSRGRKPLDPEIKAQRDIESAKRKGGKRGRKPLDPEVKALRDAETLKRKGGKRGRKPKKSTPKSQYIPTGGKRGRPKKK